jgi:hypothetical protein
MKGRTLFSLKERDRHNGMFITNSNAKVGVLLSQKADVDEALTRSWPELKSALNLDKYQPTIAMVQSVPRQNSGYCQCQ